MDREQYLAIIADAREIYARKNRAYGSSYHDGGLIGVLLRLSDKFARLRHILRDHGYMVALRVADYPPEKLRSDLLDIINYAVMSIELLDKVMEGNDDERTRS